MRFNSFHTRHYHFVQARHAQISYPKWKQNNTIQTTKKLHDFQVKKIIKCRIMAKNRNESLKYKTWKEQWLVSNTWPTEWQGALWLVEILSHVYGANDVAQTAKCSLVAPRTLHCIQSIHSSGMPRLTRNQEFLHLEEHPHSPAWFYSEAQHELWL